MSVKRIGAACALAVLAGAGLSVPAIGAAIVADRTGKGLRTAPRDALITLSTPPGGITLLREGVRS